jgi:menaquinol-cytochrome c reductase iron-sulfur subunit
MTAPENLSRRSLLAKLGVLLNGIIAAVLAIPVLRYLMAPAALGRKDGYKAWLPLGTLSDFPEGQTRLANFRNPMVKQWDGQTENSACWVRRLEGSAFQVFAVNCMHLGCPVRWFPQSGLFLCPCHGGAYYQDGARASGPPERGLFEYPYKVEGDKLWIKAGELPTPGASAMREGKRLTCA